MIGSNLELLHLLQDHIDSWESECVEFKRANDNFSTSDIGKYFSAISNEANLRGKISGWLIFGIDNSTRKIVGTDYRRDLDRLNALKKQISDGTEPSLTFRDIHVLDTDIGRVVLFEIPPAPRGIPISWNGHCWARANQSLVPLDQAKHDEIRNQSLTHDWSATICVNATIADLDPNAIRKARESYSQKFSERISSDTIHSWDDVTFLNRAKLTINDSITRATILLLGKTESTHHLSPYVAEMTWKLDGEEVDYEHFHPPFILTSSQLYQKIRNIKLLLMRPGDLIPMEIPKYDQRIVLEALHNCIAHQDYSKCERIIVTELPAALIFQNAGTFYDGTPIEYIQLQKIPTKYRNRFLAEAMVNLRMIDTMGFGIRDVMFRGQAKRFLPLPDFDVTDGNYVRLKIPGRFMDHNYSNALLTHTDLSWSDIIALDQVQKKLIPDHAIMASLRRRSLIEGRKPHIRIASQLAEQPEAKTEYIRHRAFDDDYYCKLILEYLEKFGPARRADFYRLIADKLSTALDENQKSRKIGNLLQLLRKNGKIEPVGTTQGAQWHLKSTNS